MIDASLTRFHLRFTHPQSIARRCLSKTVKDLNPCSNKTELDTDFKQDCRSKFNDLKGWTNRQDIASKHLSTDVTANQNNTCDVRSYFKSHLFQNDLCDLLM